MLNISPQTRVHIHIKPVDFRKQINGLVRLCEQELKKDSYSGEVFVFRSRNRTGVKILFFDGHRIWLAQKRLVKGKFRFWPSSHSELKTVQSHYLHTLLFGGNPELSQAETSWKRVSMSRETPL